ncbi:DUF1772 domain-containing protein [Catellatospora coxensis]|uniref:Membrane protein n=1 Tax=Catellatospora coxensis TaxID=310354 RepID=A0A8J3KZF3_9ACTN|nr:DUF1772 domain-containing protein [Catellatospora coxensis]GIG04915.1 membrane protein [Catellatospora coxensis]
MIVQVAATVTMGIMAGVFGLYAHTVMPGLRRTDDRTFVGAFQALDRAIINPWFMLGGFLGAFVFTAASVVLLLTGPGGAALAWAFAALVLYLLVLVITVAVNVPMNNAIKAAGDPDRITDLAGVRARFDEAKWARWNLVRTVATTAAVVCLAVMLVQNGR